MINDLYRRVLQRDVKLPQGDVHEASIYIFIYKHDLGRVSKLSICPRIWNINAKTSTECISFQNNQTSYEDVEQQTRILASFPRFNYFIFKCFIHILVIETQVREHSTKSTVRNRNHQRFTVVGGGGGKNYLRPFHFRISKDSQTKTHVALKLARHCQITLNYCMSVWVQNRTHTSSFMDSMLTFACQLYAFLERATYFWMINETIAIFP